MEIHELADIPLVRIKVRALVKCGDDYLFIQRQKHGKRNKFLCFPGGRVKKSDRDPDDKHNMGKTLRRALVRELEEELAAQDIVIEECLGVSSLIKHDREVLFKVSINSYDWEMRTGKEFSNPHKGTYELVKVQKLAKEVLGKRALHLKPKEWRKLVYSLAM